MDERGTRDIPQLTGLRGLAALWVFIYHACMSLQDPGWLIWLSASGCLGVDIFFVLSGFVIALNYNHVRCTPADWGGFLWKRLARVYPAHLTALVLFGVFALLYGQSFAVPSYMPLEGFLRSVTLTQAWALPIPRYWNVVSWSVSAELAAYIAFPVLMLGALRIRSRSACLLIAALLFAVMACVTLPRPFGGGTMSYGMPRIAAEFTTGVLLWRFRELGGAKLLTYASIPALVLLFIGGNSLAGKTTALIYTPLAAFLVYGLATGNGPLERLLSSPVAQYAGRVSYCFYLIHVIALTLVRIKLWDWAAVVAGFFLALGMAHMLYKYVEVPARAWMLARRPFSSPAPVVPASGTQPQ